MPGIKKKDAHKLIWPAIGLAFSLLSAGNPGFSSEVYVSLEEHILQSKIILIGKAIEKSAEPVKIDEQDHEKEGIEQVRYYSLKIEASKVLKGENIGNQVRLLYPEFKFRKPEGVIIAHEQAYIVDTELEDWGEERIWFLDESKGDAGFYRKVTLCSLDSVSLVETTLEILQMSESEQVVALIKMLASDNRSYIWTALDMLPRRKAKAAVEPLISMIAVEDEEIRDKVCWALLRINDDAGNLKLIQVLENNLRNKIDLGWMAGIIENFRDRRVIPVLIEALAYSYPDNSIQVVSISKLGEFRAGEAIKSLLPFLDNANANVRYETCEALGKIGDPKALPHLEQALKKASQRERENINKAIQEIRK